MNSCWYRHNLQINAGTYSAVKSISMVLALKRLPWWVLFTLRYCREMKPDHPVGLTTLRRSLMYLPIGPPKGAALTINRDRSTASCHSILYSSTFLFKTNTFCEENFCCNSIIATVCTFKIFLHPWLIGLNSMAAPVFLSWACWLFAKIERCLLWFKGWCQK